MTVATSKARTTEMTARIAELADEIIKDAEQSAKVGDAKRAVMGIGDINRKMAEIAQSESVPAIEVYNLLVDEVESRANGTDYLTSKGQFAELIRTRQAAMQAAAAHTE